MTQIRIQLWIVPANTVPLEPEKFESNVATFKGMFFEMGPYDDLGVWYEDSEGMGPGVGASTHVLFADVLHQQQNSVGYVVTYSSPDSLPGAWRRRAEADVEGLKSLNIDASRLKIIFGGQRTESKMQLWVLPKDAPPPVAAAGRESLPTEVIKAGELSAEYLAYKGHEVQSFRALSDVLRTDKTTRAFIVVRLDAPPPPEGEVQETTADDPAPISDLPELPDLTKLVEKWRSDLTATHKIRDDRIIVIFLPGTELTSNSMTVWFVPKGQPLPDPNKDEAAEEEEDPAGR